MRLISLLLFVLLTTSLCAQSKKKKEQWIGIHNLSFKHKDESVGPRATSNPNVVRYSREEDKRFSMGFFYRKINKSNNIYHQIDLLELGWEKDQSSTDVVNTAQGYKEVVHGKGIKDFNLTLGYQVGKLWPIVGKLSADVAARMTGSYRNIRTWPVASIGYPETKKSARIGLNLELGVHYQLFKQLNISYNFIPVAFVAYWQHHYVDNIVLPERQRKSTSIEAEYDFVEDVFSTRNFSVSYTF